MEDDILVLSYDNTGNNLNRVYGPRMMTSMSSIKYVLVSGLMASLIAENIKAYNKLNSKCFPTRRSEPETVGSKS